MATYPPPVFSGGYYYPAPCPYTYSYPAPASGFSPALAFPAAAYPPPPPGFVPVPANTTPIHHHRPGFVPSPAYMPPSASSPSGEPTAPPPRGYATPPLAPSTTPTPSTPLPFPAPGPWKPPPPPSGAPSSPPGAGVTPPFSPVQGVPYSSPPPGSITPSYPSPPGSSTPPGTAAPPPPTSGESPGHAMPPSQGSPPSTGYQPPSASSPSGEPTASASTYTAPGFSPVPAYGAPPAYPYAAPLTGHAPLLKLEDIEVDAVQRHASDLFLDRLPSSSSTAARDSTAALGRPPLDCLHADVFDRTPEVTSSGATANVSFGSSASSATTAPTPFFDFTSAPGSTTIRTISSRASSASSMSPTTAVAYVAPQMFAEMPTPSSLHGTQAIALNFCYGHQTQFQSSCVQGGSTNLSEQNFDGMCQPYGFHSLKRQSVSLADGTEHKYFTLPADYPLERAVPEPVFDVYDDETEDYSNAFVDMSASTPEQRPYEDVQQESEDLDKCVHKASGNAFREQLLKCFSKAPETEHTSACLNIMSVVQDFTLELQQHDDERECNCPDIKASSSSVKRSSQLSIEHKMRKFRLLWDPGASTLLQSSKCKPPGELSYVAIGFPKILNLCNQVGTHVQQLRDPCLKVLVTSERRKKWDPGAPVIFTHMTQPYFVSAIMCYLAFNWRWPEVNAAAVLVLAVPCSKGKHSLFLANDGNSRTNHSFPKLLMQFLWAATMRTPLENISSLLELSLEKRRQVQWDPGIELLLYELLWLKTVRKGTEYALTHLLAMKFGTHDSTYFIDTATTMCSPANLIQQGRNFAAVLCFWLPIFNDMHCCQIFQKCNAISSQLCWHQDIKFNGIPLWLINFQVP